MTKHKHSFTNHELAEIFERIGSLMEIKGEVVFKIRAYQRAAETLRTMGEDINTVAAEGRLEDVPNIGKAISEKIQELLDTGRLEFLERLESEVPPSLVELLEIPDVGPRKVALFWKELGIIDRTGLEAAAREGKLRTLPGMGDKSEQRILAGIEALGRRTGRMTLGLAHAKAGRWLAWLREQPGVVRAEPAGSLRRWRDTIGDLDMVVACQEDSQVMESFLHHPDVAHIEGQGEARGSVEFKDGTRMQLWVAPPERFGALWLYATGSKAHNVRLRELALKKKLSLSDRGMQTEDGQLLTYDSEEAIYQVLGLPLTPPELREDRGEIEAGLKKALPQLIELGDLRAELHAHTTWSDGTQSIVDMARAAQGRGLTTLAITDHSNTIGIVNGLGADGLRKQAEAIQKARAELGPDFTLLHGIEVDIMADGSLGLADEVLAELDIVIASLHASLRQPRDHITNRLIRAIRNPHVDIIGHPSGRLLPNREGADLDWEAVLNAAKESGVALEINASPSRLDLDDVYAHRAIELGIPLTINTDAHSFADLELAVYGVSVARRAWAQARHVLNTWSGAEIQTWIQNRKRM